MNLVLLRVGSSCGTLNRCNTGYLLLCEEQGNAYVSQANSR
jgi:hypothetical protein